MTYQEPIHDVAQLAHVEIYSPDVDATVWFFRDLLGMSVAGREGNSVHMRAYEDFYHHSLTITHRDKPGLGHIGWRSLSPQALERRAAAVEKTGLGRGWIEGATGHGKAYEFTSPDGHLNRIFWDVDYAEIPEEDRSCLLNRPQKRPLQGVPVRRLDHVNIMTSDVSETRGFYEDALGFRTRENIVLGGEEAGAWMSVSPLVHEIACMKDRSGAKGRFHHVAFWYGLPQHLNDIADVFAERGIQVEAGPGKHGISQAMFMYVYEPGGNRVELFGDCGYLIFDPAWKTRTWTEENLDQGVIFYGSPVPQEFFLYGTPDMPQAAAAAE
ncbi:catechol 2,3-dioxygenase [Salipiger sp. P9]|uniref:catechol 2,3-dioxygenase n=1 Tax=Salipiger pentaromativorans TaxID=2943193 RepID=UPI00215723F4|nr:catechol 2,3-dioxygenase [Salipiger pentaromativorans]MCR8547400.1 catechol 2,3-dioxygenase [Salipiger pentaromativorans]